MYSISVSSHMCNFEAKMTDVVIRFMRGSRVYLNFDPLVATAFIRQYVS